MQEDEEIDEPVVAEEKWEAAGGAGSALGEVREEARVMGEEPGNWFERFKKWLASSGPDLKVGTLQYTGLGLMVMCLWLFWGDMVFSLSEAVFPQSVVLQLDRLGVSPFWMGLLSASGTFSALINFVLVPVISFRSDRLRSRRGRRIPYIMWTIIPVSVSMAALGFTDDMGRWIRGSGWPAYMHMAPMTMIIMVVGTMVVVFDVSNVFINTVFWYLFRDVIPNKYITRFMAVFALVGTCMNIVFQKFFYPRIETATREIYIFAAMLYLVGFTVMCVMVKEGEYPPPEPVDKREPWLERLWKAVVLYFTQSFSHPLILMMYMGTAVAAFVGATAAYQQLFYLRYLHFTTGQMAQFTSWQLTVILFIKLPIGWLIDKKIHPMKTLFYSQMLLLPTPFLFFFLGDYRIAGLVLTSYGMWVAISIYQFPIVQFNALSGYPLITRIYPVEQFGQFSSANSMVGSVIRIGASVAGIVFIDWTMAKFGYYGTSFSFLWQGCLSLVAFVSACVLFRYWHLFGGVNFSLDLKAAANATGPSRAALWRPLKIGGVVSVVIVAAGFWGLAVLANRPDMGFTVNYDKELTTAKSIEDLQELMANERAGFDRRHAENLAMLAKKHWFYQSDAVTELRNYQESLKELETVGAKAEVKLRGPATTAASAPATEAGVPGENH